MSLQASTPTCQHANGRVKLVDAPVTRGALTPAVFATTGSGGVSLHAYEDQLHTALEGGSCRGLQR